MRGIKWMGACVTVAAALAGLGTGTAAAAAYPPACAASLAAAEVGTTGSCTFSTPTDFTHITVVTDGTVTATVRCVHDSGYVSSYSRTFSYGPTPSPWGTWAYGDCRLTLTSGFSGTTAAATATPFIGIPR